MTSPTPSLIQKKKWSKYLKPKEEQVATESEQKEIVQKAAEESGKEMRKIMDGTPPVEREKVETRPTERCTCCCHQGRKSCSPGDHQEVCSHCMPNAWKHFHDKPSPPPPVSSGDTDQGTVQGGVQGSGDKPKLDNEKLSNLTGEKMDKPTTESWEKKVKYLFKNGCVNDNGSRHVQYSDSQYANQFTEDLIIALIHQLLTEERQGAFNEVSSKIKKDYPSVTKSTWEINSDIQIGVATVAMKKLLHWIEAEERGKK